MDLNKKEKFIKEALTQENHDLDTHALWNDIQPRVESREKDRKWILFFFLGALSMGLVWMLFSWYGQETDIALNAHNASTDPSRSYAAQAQDVNNGAPETYAALNSNADQSTADATSFSETTELSDVDIVEINHKDASKARYATSELVEAKIENEGSLGSTDITASYSNDINPNSQSPSSNTVKNGVSISPGQLQILTLSRIDPLDPIGIQSVGLLEIDPHHAEVIIPHRNYDWLPFIQWHAGVIKTNSISEIIASDAILNGNVFGKESGVYGYSSTFNLGWERNDGWYYGLGIDYTQSSIRYQNTESVIELGSSLGVNAIYVDRNGQTTTISGELMENTLTNYNINWYRQHRHINFEVFMGKRLIDFGHFSLSADAGLLYGIVQQHNGYYFEDSFNGFMKFENGEDNIYADSGNMKLRSTLALNYNLNHFSFGIQALYRHDLNGITKSNNFYKTRNTDFGIRLGLTYFPKW
ncbi:MAG: hypothetical protein HKN09_09665 [Saprospiraceae bacterium]|nr:hypothetical protein [Saprospiraceae bacterium]